MAIIGQVQLGKNGVTDNFIQTLKGHFQKYSIVKVCVLKSCCRNKEELKEIVEKIMGHLGMRYKAKSIGYTISIRRLRKDREQAL
ncbi:MAG: YhbY family RNA-binding protein [Nanoarchaeota archaeon]|nr:YhbY family RNA-binding protein [Nanoarchaeota archaeon]